MMSSPMPLSLCACPSSCLECILFIHPQDNCYVSFCTQAQIYIPSEASLNLLRDHYLYDNIVTSLHLS